MTTIPATTVGKVIFPLDKGWGLQASVYSPNLAREMVWLSGLLPYEQCARVFARIGHKSIPATSIWRQTQHHGTRIHTYVEEIQQTRHPEQMIPTECVADHAQPKGISLDGGMVNTREEGWKELKVGAVFDVASQFERHPVTGHLTKMAHGVNVHYTATLGTKTAFEPALWALALDHNAHTSTRQVVVADGAAWIWNIADYLFPQAHQVVDWYHATAHLAKTAHLLYAHADDQRQTWYTTMRQHLYTGAIETICTTLTTSTQPQQAHYFETHAHRLNYAQTRLLGFPLGSGTVESGIKQFKQRLSGAGMRWKLTSAQQMATLRATILSDTFEDLWSVA